MNCIIFDLEWNELVPYQLAMQNEIGFPLSGEIIEIGAVRMTGDGDLSDRFDRLVKPSFLRRMHPHVKRLTGITWEMLQEEDDFKTVMTEFNRWCGDDALLLSWGTSDRQVLAENLRLHHLPRTWLKPWYDAQKIFGRYCLDTYEQYGLARAAEYMGVAMADDAHRAVNDAAYTAQICERLPLRRAIREYDFHRNLGPLEFRPTVEFQYFDGYRDSQSAWADPAIWEIYLPDQDAPLALTEPERLRRHTLLALAMDHLGKRYLVRWKTYQYKKGRGTVHGVARETYRAVPSLIAWYRDVAGRNTMRRRLHEAKGNPAFR